MIGDRLDHLARRILREDSYRLIVGPAVADLQFEAAGGIYPRVRGYAGVWLAFAGAFLAEAISDTRRASLAMTAPGVMRPALVTGAVTVCVLTFRTALDFAPFTGPKGLPVLLLVPSTIPIAVLPALTMAARGGWQRAPLTRGILIAAMGVALVTFVAMDQGVTRSNQAYREIVASATGIQQVRRGAREMSVLDLLRTDPETAAANGIGHPNEFKREAHFRLAFAASCVAYALFGIAFAPVRLWIAAVIVSAICIGHFMLFWPVLVLSRGVPTLVAVSGWLPTIVLTTVAVATLRIQAYVKKAG